MIATVKELKFKTLPTLNKFVFRVGSIEAAHAYATWLKKKPKRTDFIGYTNTGEKIKGHTPIFRGWTVDDETSNKTIKVAKRGKARAYFDTKDGVLLVDDKKMSDQVTYNDLAIFFEGALPLK